MIISYLNMKNSNFSIIKKYLHSDHYKISLKWKHSQLILNFILWLTVSKLCLIINFKYYFSEINNIFISLWLIIFLKIQKWTVSSIDISIYIKKIFKQQIISTFISFNISFYAIENKQLCIVLIMLQNNVQILYHNKIWDLIENYYNAAERAVHDCLSRINSKISLTLDCWSHNQLFFLIITDYFINWDWNYNEVLLEFEHI